MAFLQWRLSRRLKGKTSPQRTGEVAPNTGMQMHRTGKAEGESAEVDGAGKQGNFEAEPREAEQASGGEERRSWRRTRWRRQEASAADLEETTGDEWGCAAKAVVNGELSLAGAQQGLVWISSCLPPLMPMQLLPQ